MPTLLAAIERSASTGQPVTLEGSNVTADAADLLANGLAELSEGDCGCAVLAGHDPEGRPYTVHLIDVYAHDLDDERT
jgi:hypothetical protein